MSSALNAPLINLALCTQCGLCVARCATNTLALVRGRPVVVAPDACSYAGDCETVCPTGAIALPYLIEFAPPAPGHMA